MKYQNTKEVMTRLNHIWRQAYLLARMEDEPALAKATQEALLKEKDELLKVLNRLDPTPTMSPLEFVADILEGRLFWDNPVSRFDVDDTFPTMYNILNNAHSYHWTNGRCVFVHIPGAVGDYQAGDITLVENNKISLDDGYLDRLAKSLGLNGFVFDALKEHYLP